MVAFVGGDLNDSSPWAEWSGTMRTLPRLRRTNAAPFTLSAEELPLAEDFVLRSFPKGLAQRRVLVQDFAEGVRQTIVEVRQAVVAAAQAVRGAYQSIRETRAQLLQRLADQARMSLAQDVVREGRRSRAAGERYAQACARLRWSEVTTEAQWSEAFVAEPQIAA
jgi:hypothetical protein